jgi:hypothetical protein
MKALKCFRERRACWWCHGDFLATRRELVFCSKACGCAWRGLDANGGPLKKVAA